MRRLPLACTLAGLAVSLFGFHLSAAAQIDPEPRVGSRIPQKPETASRQFTQDTVRRFAECVVKRQQKLASEFVLDRTTLQFEIRYYPLADSYCLGLQSDPHYDEIGLKIGGDMMRFALAEALLQTELARIDPASFASAAPLVQPAVNEKDYQPQTNRSYTAEELKKFDEDRRRDLLTLVEYRFGECVGRADPQGSRTFLQAVPDSNAEGAALQGLMPALGGCVEKGAQFKLDRTVLRGALALAYYNLAHAPKAPPAQSRTNGNVP